MISTRRHPGRTGRSHGPAAGPPSLRDVAEALRRLGAATLSQLAAEVGGTATEVERLLSFWERRGDVHTCRDPQTAGCGTSCRACPLGRTPRARPAAVVYEWVQ